MKLDTVHVVHIPDRDDGIYVFADAQDAADFLEACNDWRANMTEEPVLYDAHAKNIIETERSEQEEPEIILITVTSSPYHMDEDLPWSYEPDAFCAWVHEVFLEGYKRDVAVPDLDMAISIVRNMGYDIETTEEP